MPSRSKPLVFHAAPETGTDPKSMVVADAEPDSSNKRTEDTVAVPSAGRPILRLGGKR